MTLLFRRATLLTVLTILVLASTRTVSARRLNSRSSSADGQFEAGLLDSLLAWLRDLIRPGETLAPTVSPTPSPDSTTLNPTLDPTASPTNAPTVTPSNSPTTFPPTTSPSLLPSPTPTPEPAWQLVETTGPMAGRHEACFVFVPAVEKAYLIGGRNEPPVNEYDPSTRTWREVSTGPGFLLHHMQCVAVDSEIYIVSAWTGTFPRETNVDVVLVYDTVEHVWSNRTGLPVERQRGSGASVLRGREIFLAFGNRGGHGNHADALVEFDAYDIDNDTWRTLPDARYKRDHTGGALLEDGRFCVAGGRDSGMARRVFFNATVAPTECFHFETNEWQVEEDIPTPRAGAAYGLTCDGKLMVAGGEGFNQAFDTVEVFDGSSWETVASMNEPRHGTGLAVDCSCNQIHIATGSVIQGGNPESETTTTETLFADGVDRPCLP